MSMTKLQVKFVQKSVHSILLHIISKDVSQMLVTSKQMRVWTKVFVNPDEVFPPDYLNLLTLGRHICTVTKFLVRGNFWSG